MSFCALSGPIIFAISCNPYASVFFIFYRDINQNSKILYQAISIVFARFYKISAIVQLRRF